MLVTIMFGLGSNWWICPIEFLDQCNSRLPWGLNTFECLRFVQNVYWNLFNILPLLESLHRVSTWKNVGELAWSKRPGCSCCSSKYSTVVTNCTVEARSASSGNTVHCCTLYPILQYSLREVLVPLNFSIFENFSLAWGWVFYFVRIRMWWQILTLAVRGKR